MRPSLVPTRPDPEQHTADDQAEQHSDDNHRAGQSEGSDEDIGQVLEPGRVCRRRVDADDDRLLLEKHGAENYLGQDSAVNASSASVRTATPLGPFGK